MCLRGSRVGSPMTISSFGPVPTKPVSSCNSLTAAWSGSSPWSTKPPGRAQAPCIGGCFRWINSTVSPLRTAASAARAGLSQPLQASQVAISLTVPSSPLLIGSNCFEQVLLRKRGPENIGEVEFRIGHLPEEEIGDAFLPAGPDDQVRVGHVGGVQVLGDGFLVDVLE